MGLFWDKFKNLFKKPVQLSPSSPQISDDLQQYERNERQEHPEDRLDAIKYAYEHEAFKKSSGKDVELLKTTFVGFGPEYNKQLANRKRKSQQRNWHKWKRRLKK